MLDFVIYNIIVTFGGRVFQQTIGIPLLVDLFLYSYEADFIQELLRKENKFSISCNFTFRYTNDVLSLDNQKMVTMFNASIISNLLYRGKDTPNTENIPREIIEWAKQDKHFHITPAAKHISELMKTNNIVTVIGATMEGKSASIRHIAIQLMDSFEYQIVPCRGPLDIRMLYEQNTNQVFVIDDIYGKCALDMTKLNAWIEYELKLSSILSYSKGRTKILASSQSHIYNKAKFKLLNQDTDSEALCDLTSDNAALSEEAIQDISSKISYLKKLIRT